MGFIVTIAGIVRTWYIYKSLIAEYDLTWYAFPLWIAAAIEIDLGVVSSVSYRLQYHQPVSFKNSQDDTILCSHIEPRQLGSSAP